MLEHGFKSLEVKTIVCSVFGRGKSGIQALGFGLCTRRGDRGLPFWTHSAWVAGDPCEENLSGDERTGARVMEKT